MKTMMLMTNFDRENALACTREVCQYLAGIGIEVLMSDTMESTCRCEGVRYGEFYQMLGEAEAVLAVGGDGTILHAAKHAVAFHKPVFGINAGRLGFLAGLEPDEIGACCALVRKSYLRKLEAGERAKVLAALARRGFGYGTAKEAVERCLLELEQEREDWE